MGSYCSGSGSCGRKFPMIILGLREAVSEDPRLNSCEWDYLHLVVVFANPKRKTAVDDVLHPVNGALERAGREERVVGRVERDGSKLLPVPHVGLLCQDLVESDFALLLC